MMCRRNGDYLGASDKGPGTPLKVQANNPYAWWRCKFVHVSGTKKKAPSSRRQILNEQPPHQVHVSAELGSFCMFTCSGPYKLADARQAVCHHCWCFWSLCYVTWLSPRDPV